MSSVASRRPWWNHTAVYVVMALVTVIVEALAWFHPRHSGPSAMAAEQQLLQRMDARFGPVNFTTVALQQPALVLTMLLLIVLAAAAWLAGWALMVAWWMRHRALRRHRGPSAAWSIGDIARVAIAALFAAHILPFVQTGLRAASHHPVGDLHVWMLASMGVVDGIAIVMVVALARHKARAWAEAIGWNARRWMRHCRQGVVTYIGILPALSVAIMSVLGLSAWLHYAPPPEPLMGLFLNESRWSVLALSTLFACVLGPVAEETFFRGVIYAALRRRWGARWGILISGGCFAALHTNLVGFLPIWLLGATLAYLYETTGSLVAPMTLHILHNTALIVTVWLTKAFLGAAGV